jgi:aconitate hydratase
MDARSIAATAVNGGFLTPATEVDYRVISIDYEYNRDIYTNRVYKGFKKPITKEDVKFGPNIADWPEISALPQNLLLKVVTVIYDPVTTTDELIPSGETSSFRSNPLKLAEFTLSRKDPSYVSKSKEVQTLEKERQRLVTPECREIKASNGLKEIYNRLTINCETGFSSITDMIRSTGIGSTIYAVKPGDGSAREQAASCQKILGGWANIAVDYATKRYKSNLINWGILPFSVDGTSDICFEVGDLIFIPGIKQKVEKGEECIQACLIRDKAIKTFELLLENVSKDERDIILKGCLINYYSKQK